MLTSRAAADCCARAPIGTSAYNYNHPPPTGYHQQAYSQHGYGSGYVASGSQPTYGQLAQNPHPWYDQQQGYNSTTGYGSVTNPPQDGHIPSYGIQGETGQAPPSAQPSSLGPNPAYPSQAGCGMPPTSQSPTQGGFGAP
ncbi:hypothetical protein Ancab_023475 [Ancistrocladus abbreviatus]